MTEWIRVTKKDRCPICDRPDWCCVLSDGKLVNCMRVESSKPCKNGGWLHSMDDPIAPPPKPKKKRQAVKTQAFAALAMKYANNMVNPEHLAKELGVSAESLVRLRAGYDGCNHSFPMFDGRGKIIGIRLRNSRGKFAVTGSRAGLFLPLNSYPKPKTPLFIAEGPTDTAALLTLGFDAIGRPSCSGGTLFIKTYLDHTYTRPVIIMTDKDTPKKRPDGSVFHPGRDGAYRLAKEIRSYVTNVRCVRPQKYNDIRQWLNNGATADMVMAVANSTRFL